MLKKIIIDWNVIDSLFWGIDGTIEKIRSIKKETPDIELMIEAETKHLKSENESLKKLSFPKKVTKNIDCKAYICPNSKCGITIASLLVEQYKIKFCPECGQRIYCNCCDEAE